MCLLWEGPVFKIQFSISRILKVHKAFTELQSLRIRAFIERREKMFYLKLIVFIYRISSLLENLWNLKYSHFMISKFPEQIFYKDFIYARHRFSIQQVSPLVTSFKVQNYLTPEKSLNLSRISPQVLKSRHCQSRFLHKKL